MLCKLDFGGKGWKWITYIQEYDLATNLTKLINDQGMEKLIVETNMKVVGIDAIEEFLEIFQKKHKRFTFKICYHQYLDIVKSLTS